VGRGGAYVAGAYNAYFLSHNAPCVVHDLKRETQVSNARPGAPALVTYWQ
jgi:hypothetical protein